MTTFADRVLSFNQSLHFDRELPNGIAVMNPFQNNPAGWNATELFYRRYYNDNNKRHILIGINPGRFGAGQTGVPFTDPIRLRNECHIPYVGGQSRESSSVFIYEMIQAYGGVEKFYAKFFISALCPLGFTKINAKGTAVNYNYYDNKELMEASYPFIVENLKKQLDLGIFQDKAICLGSGKNHQFLKKLNQVHSFFSEIIPLEHPRFIIQYKATSKLEYINKYVNTLNSLSQND